MALNALDYGQFNTEHAAITTCMDNISAELTAANNALNNATADASGTWAATDIEDWNLIYNDINKKFERMKTLMSAAGASAQSLSSTEQAYSGFDTTTL